MLVALIVVGLAAVLFIFRTIPGIRAYFSFRGKRLVTCPETKKPEAVQVAAGEAALGAFLAEPTLRLVECSRWPERQDCGQDCLQQIEIDPENCLVWNLVSQWYEGKNCVFCHHPIAAIRHSDHKPALLGPDHMTMEWKQFRPQDLPAAFESHQPVCWNCHVTETFRRTHPELVTDRRPDAKRMA